jgi:hypothetical protein
MAKELLCEKKIYVKQLEKKAEKKKKFTKRDNIFHKDKSNSKRIATVASVYEIARFIRKPVDIIQDFFLKPESKRNTKQPRPKAKRVWASLENSSEKVINEIFEEALQRDPLNQKEWVVLVDGDLNQIKNSKNYLKNLD